MWGFEVYKYYEMYYQQYWHNNNGWPIKSLWQIRLIAGEIDNWSKVQQIFIADDPMFSCSKHITYENM